MKYIRTNDEAKGIIDEIDENEIVICSSERFGSDIKSYPVETYDFMKYCQLKDFDFNVRLEDEKNFNSEILHSNDIWLPVFYLASQITMSVIVGLISDYLKFKLGKNFEMYDNTIHFKVKKVNIRGELKEIEYNGPTSKLSDELLKFDINNFFEE